MDPSKITVLTRKDQQPLAYILPTRNMFISEYLTDLYVDCF
jgi:hypothetical protein